MFKLVFAVLLGLSCALLNVYIVWNIATMFNVQFILNLGYYQLIGLYMALRVIIFSTGDGTDIEDKKIYSKIISQQLIIMIVWGFAYLLSLVNFN